MSSGFLASTRSAALIVALSPVAGIVIDKLPSRKALLLVWIGGVAMGVCPFFAIMTKAERRRRYRAQGKATNYTIKAPTASSKRPVLPE